MSTTIDDSALLIAGRGNVLVCDVGEAPPTLAELLAYASSNYGDAIEGYTTIGHTSPTDLPEWDSDGGDSETKRTWEKENVYEKVDPVTNWFTVNALQFDNYVMSLREGGGTATTANTFASPTTRSAIEKGALIVYIKGGEVIGEYIPRVSIRGDGSIAHDVDEFSQIPLRFTQLSAPSGMSPHYWIGSKFGSTAAARPWAPATTTP